MRCSFEGNTTNNGWHRARLLDLQLVETLVYSGRPWKVEEEWHLPAGRGKAREVTQPIT